MRTSFWGAVSAVTVVLCGGCSSSNVTTDGASGTGGLAGTGGATAETGGGTAAGGAAGTGGLAGTGGTTVVSSTGPSFEEYTVPYNTQNGDKYSANGTLISTTNYFYVKNTGGSGSATLTISYQGYTETKQFAVDSGVQYVLASLSSPWNGTARVSTCTQSITLPGLTIGRNLAATNAMAPDFGTCLKMSGPSTSDLIPLSSCTFSGGCPGQACPNNCGFNDPGCCGGCPSGKSCSSGFCM